VSVRTQNKLDHLFADRPDLFARVQAGELSATAACVAAGWEVRKISVPMELPTQLIKEYPAQFGEGVTPTPMTTKVINVTGRDRDELMTDPAFVYVGRQTRNGWPQSPWGNPFRLSTFKDLGELGQRHMAVKCYQHLVIDPDEDIPADMPDHLLDVRRFVRSNFHTLRGKTLGCWCCEVREIPVCGWGVDHLCHAVILARLADGGLYLDWQKPERPRRRGRQRKGRDDQGWFDFETGS
jgi:hypothetical protein